MKFRLNQINLDRVRRYGALGLVTSSIGMGTFACSGAEHESQKLDESSIDTSYVIRAYTSGDSGAIPVQFGNSSPKKGDLSTLANPIGPAAIAGFKSYDLLRMAASECGLGKSRGDGSTVSGRCTDFNEPIYSAYGTYAPFDVYTKQYGASCGAAPGNHVPFAIFGDEATTCDQQIDQEEVLLCAAGKLADLSEADVPTSWSHAFNGLRYGDNMLALNGGMYAPTIGGNQKELPPLVFPVLDPKTKFIVRDLALQALSYIPLLDSRPHTINGTNYSCSELYATAPGLAAGTPRDSAYDKLYNIHANPGAAGSAFYPPIATWPPTAKRLDQLTQILRATGEMTKDLIEKSIDNDLAAAAEKVTGLTPEQRIQALWVASDDPFNSMAHASRVLFGRQATLGFDESAPLASNCALNPTSSWLRPDDLWKFKAPPAYAARGADRILRTKIDLQADTLVHAAGVLFAADEANVPVMREALVKSLADRSPGLSQSLFGAQVSAIPDGALIAGIQRQRATVGAVTDQSFAGMNASAIGTQMTSIGRSGTLDGVTFRLNNLITRSTAVADSAALLGPLQASSTCRETSATAILGGQATPTSGAGLTAQWHPRQLSFATQDAFAMAQQLRARALILRKAAGEGAGPSSQARDGLVAELDAWAGGLRVVADTTGAAGDITLDLFDIDLASYKSTSVKDDFVLAFGTTEETGALVAACAAGTATCPEVIPGGIWNATSASLTASNSPEIGLLRDRWTLQFAAAGFAPASVLGGRGFNDRTVYVVRKGTPNAPGIVLGALRGTGGVPTRASFAFSPFRRELVDRAFAFPKNASTLGASLGDTRDMCIPGVPRDLYVPMESESTSDGDAYESSWKHYMTLARQAAEKSDSLGRELIQIGTEKDTRTEGFNAGLAESNGVYMNPDCIKRKDGNIDTSACPSELGDFLNEKSVDLVFLTSDPVPSGTKADDIPEKLRTQLGCTGNSTTDPAACRKLAAVDSQGKSTVDVHRIDPTNVVFPPAPAGKTGFYYSALNLVKLPELATASIDQCEKIAKFNSASPPPETLEQSINVPGMRDDVPFNFAAGGVRVEVQTDGEFRAGLHGAPLLDSRPTLDGAPSHLWPGCARGGDCEWGIAPTQRGMINRTLATAFYACDPSVPLGACHGGGSVAADLTAIRWELFGAAYLGHAMVGRAPAGAFVAPVPVANFVVNSARTSGPCALVPSALATGRWSNVAGAYAPLSSEWANEMSADEMRLLTEDGPVVDVSSPFGSLPTNAAALMPSWYRAIYAPDASTANHCWKKDPSELTYLHVPAHNVALEWSPYQSGNTSLSSVMAEDVEITGAANTGINAFGRAGMARWSGRAASFRDFVTVLKGSLVDKKYGRRIEENFGLQAVNAEFTSIGKDPVSGKNRYQATIFRRFNDAPEIIDDGVFDFNATPVKYHWYDYDVWTNDHYSSDVYYPCNTSGDDNEAFGRCFGQVGERLPSYQSPNERMRFFVNSGMPADDGIARRQFTQSLVLTCIGTTAPPRVTGIEPPVVADASDIVALEGWMQSQRNTSALALGRLYAENMPAVVIQSFNRQSTGSTALGGRAGEASLAASGALQRTAASFREALIQFQNIQQSTAVLRSDLAIRDAASKVKDASRRIEDLQALRAAAANAVSGISSCFGGPNGPNVAGVVGASIDAGFQVAIGAATDSLRGAQDEQDNAERRAIFTRFAGEVAGAAKAQTQALSNTRQAAIDLQSALLRLKSERSKSLDLAARASGAGAWICGKDSKTSKDIECTSPVNTVLNRRFSATKIRYEAALRDARALAYIARRAIEQRFGQRLDQMSSPIGPLEAPASWADTVCSLQGVDYEALRKESVLNAGGAVLTDAESAAWNDKESQRLAKSNVVDYVDKLQRFVDYYGIAYPSRDGDDTTMVSLREDALRNKQSCSAPSRNLLFSSDGAYHASGVPSSAVGIWTTHLCPPGQANCVRASQLASVPVGVASSPAAWLRNEPRYANGRAEVGIAAPGNFVSQSVFLDPGSYVLSFYAASLDAAGAPSTTPANYRVAALSEDGAFVATGVYQAEPGTSANGATSVSLSQRRTLAISVANRGLYRIGFAPSAQPGGVGSIGLVQPQLQRDERAEGPTAYEPTDSERMTPSSDCPSTPAQLRGNFTRKCEDNRCFYELNTPIAIDSAAFTVNGNPLQNKLAAANFNYRHIDIAVNLVGTGLRSCDANPTPACYASGTVDYDLLHEANGIGIVAYDAAPRVFDFGTGRISSGKALATERYLTLPLSGADASLVSQQGVLKTELRGRPIDGRYTLRVYDNPALRWEKLEDIQLLLHTRYWSRVDSPSSF